MNTRFVILIFLALFIQQLNAQQSTWAFPFSYQDKWGVVDDNRQELVAPQFEKIALFWHSRSPAESALAWKNDRVGLINRKGEWLIAPKMDSICYGSYNNDPFYRVVKNGRWGVIGIEGASSKWLVKPKYSAIERFEGKKEMLAVVTNRKGQGVVNQHGKLVVPCKYPRVSVIWNSLDDPIIEVTEANGKETFRDFEGTEKSKEELLDSFEDEPDLAFTEMDTEDLAVSMAPSIRYEKGENGETIVFFKADYYEEEVTVAKEYTVEKVVTTDAFIPNIKYILLSKDGKFGMMNPKGEVITSVKHDRIEWDKHQSLAFLYQGDKVGLANYYGNQLIPTVFTSITKYDSWFFKVIHPDGYTAYANSRGKVYLPDYVNLEEE